MKTNYLLIALVLFATLLLAGCGAKETAPLTVPEGAQAGELVGLKECEFQSNSSKTKYAAECGTLVVPENWDKSDSRLIALPVTRIPASGSNHAEPVFILHGGPGLSNFSWMPPDWLFQNYEVVIVGYRGVDGTVSLSCPDVWVKGHDHIGKDLFSGQARAEYVAAIKQCAASYQEAGVDLSGYTVPGVVEDMEAARRALGYDRINLYSFSFGTRIAQIYAYMHPDSLHRLVLLGVSAPGSMVWDPADLDERIEYISELCAKDAACSSRTSNFAQTMYEVNRDMPKRWLFFKIDPDTIRLSVHMIGPDAPYRPMIFEAYLSAGEGDPSGLAMLNLITSLAPIDAQLVGDQVIKERTADLENYNGIESISLGDSIMGAPMAEWIWPMAVELPLELIPKDLRKFQETDVEMLLVNGTLDLSTLPATLDKARPYFHKAQMVLLPEFGHTTDLQTLQPEAFERLLTTYYDTGVADDSLYVYQPLSFEPGMSLTTFARLLVAAMIVLPALVIWGVVAMARRALRGRRRNANR
jgi:pimeloyl-ACP methyl ester carboxylesterase